MELSMNIVKVEKFPNLYDVMEEGFSIFRGTYTNCLVVVGGLTLYPDKKIDEIFKMTETE